MSILQRIGITKESIQRLLGLKPTPQVRTLNPKKIGRPKGHHIPWATVQKVRKEKHWWSDKELAEKYGVSICWIWNVRKHKIRKTK
jgi:hypothetical protein